MDILGYNSEEDTEVLDVILHVYLDIPETELSRRVWSML